MRWGALHSGPMSDPGRPNSTYFCDPNGMSQRLMLSVPWLLSILPPVDGFFDLSVLRPRAVSKSFFSRKKSSLLFYRAGPRSFLSASSANGIFLWSRTGTTWTFRLPRTPFHSVTSKLEIARCILLHFKWPLSRSRHTFVTFRLLYYYFNLKD